MMSSQTVCTEDDGELVIPSTKPEDPLHIGLVFVPPTTRLVELPVEVLELVLLAAAPADAVRLAIGCRKLHDAFVEVRMDILDLPRVDYLSVMIAQRQYRYSKYGQYVSVSFHTLPAVSDPATASRRDQLLLQSSPSTSMGHPVLTVNDLFSLGEQIFGTLECPTDPEEVRCHMAQGQATSFAVKVLEPGDDVALEHAANVMMPEEHSKCENGSAFCVLEVSAAFLISAFWPARRYNPIVDLLESFPLAEDEPRYVMQIPFLENDWGAALPVTVAAFDARRCIVFSDQVLETELSTFCPCPVCEDPALYAYGIDVDRSVHIPQGY